MIVNAGRRLKIRFLTKPTCYDTTVSICETGPGCVQNNNNNIIRIYIYIQCVRWAAEVPTYILLYASRRYDDDDDRAVAPRAHNIRFHLLPRAYCCRRRRPSARIYILLLYVRRPPRGRKTLGAAAGFSAVIRPSRPSPPRAQAERHCFSRTRVIVP